MLRNKDAVIVKWYENVNEDAKVAYLLTLTEKVMGKIESYEWYHIVRKSIGMCWEWVEEKKHSGDELYENIENEDEEGLIFIEGVSYVGDNAYGTQAKLIWACILDAVCYIAWQAYQYENEKYLPQSLESESDETIDKLIKKIKKVDGYQEEWAERLKEYLLANYPAGSDKKIKREEMIRLI
nr:Imm6 family immunity protein [Thermoactinomyces sp. CICC 10522]